MALVNMGHETWDAFVDKAAAREKNGPAAGGGNCSLSTDATFTRTKSLDAAVKMAKHGWQEGAQEIAKTLDQLPPGVEVLPDWTLDVMGAQVCVPAFLSGEPDCMWRHEENRREARRVSLIVQLSVPGAVDAEDMVQYAKGLCAVVRSIEAAGVEPAVYSIWHGFPTNTRCGDTYSHSVAVREFGEPMDLSKIAFAFHPSFLRRLCFSYREQSAVGASKVGCAGYGKNVDITQDVATAMVGDVGHIVIVPTLAHIANNKSTLLREANFPQLLEYLMQSVTESIGALC